MIVATAGHIDHGKTSLVRAITGTDTDRLPEEKRRGLSIDLGFAYEYAEDGTTLGFVDVPGHERFIRNMLAGVTGVDYALLVVAADDGPMPQTLEHLAILDLLGIGRGAVVVSKTDRVSPARVDAVTDDVRVLLEATALASAPTFKISAITGDGIDSLRQHLWQEARRFRRDNAGGGFRLAVDRAFTLVGSGGVVTGIVSSGAVRVGDHLVHSPAGDDVRVRTIHVNGRPSECGVAGDRCALNLVGADMRRNKIERGDWILSPALHAPTDRLDAKLRVLGSAAQPLRHWTPVHLHLAAAEVGARVAVLEGREILPGTTALVQFVLDRPIGALFGDRLIVRDVSARHTLGGGFAVDPSPPQRGRRRPERLKALERMTHPDSEAVLGDLLDCEPNGVDVVAFARARNLPADALDRIQATMKFVSVPVLGRIRAISAARWVALCDTILAALADHHRDFPDDRGVAFDDIRAKNATPALIDAAVSALVSDGKVRRNGNLLCLAGKADRPDPDDVLWARVRPMMTGNFAHPATVHELASGLDLPPAALAKFFARMARKGRAAAIADNRYYETGVLADVERRILELAAARGGSLTVAAFRESLGIGRNLAIDLLEYFDRMGLTQRFGETRKVTRKVIRDASAAFSRTGKDGKLATVD